MKPRSFQWLGLFVLFLSSLAYAQTTRDSLYVRTLGSYPSGQSYSVKCFQNGGHDYALAVFGEGIRIINIDSIAKPKVVSALTLYNCGHIIDITIQGSFAYLSGGYDGLWIVDISDPYNPVKKGHCPLPTAINLITVNAQYAFAGTHYDETTGGLHIVDISDPDNPFMVTTYDSRFVGGVATKDSLVFVTFDGKLHVLNVVNPMDIKTLFIDSTNGLAGTLLISGNYLYANANVYNITDPANPVHFPTSEFTSGTGIHCYNFVIRDSAIYGASADLEVNKLEDSVTVSHLATYDPIGYVFYLDAINKKLCVASCLSTEFNGITIYDISSLFNPQLMSYVPTLTPFAANGHVNVHNDTIVAYGKGLEIYDAVYPPKPKLIATYYDTARCFYNLTWYQNHIYAADPIGIWAFDFASKESLHLTDTFCFPSPNWATYGFTIADSTIYFSLDSTLWMVDISDPDSFGNIKTYVTEDYIIDIVKQNGLIFAANNNDGLNIFNVSNEDSVYKVGNYSTTDYAWGVVLSNGHAYVSNGDAGLEIIDIADPSSPQKVGNFNVYGYLNKVDVDSNILYVVNSNFGSAQDSAGLKVIDLSDPANPQQIGYYYLGYFDKGMNQWYSMLQEVTFDKNHIYLNSPSYGLQICEYYGPNGVLTNDSEDELNYRFKLLGSYPNPAVNFLSISYEITTPGLYEFSVYNVLGQKISLIDKGNKVPGKYTLKWNCKDSNGNKVAPGVYFYQLRDKGNNRVTKKTVVIK